jgi:riboflavin synthase
MFKGIIEHIGEVLEVVSEGSNKHFTVKNPYGSEVYIDQSIAHNGTCLTIVKIDGNHDYYVVTAIEETLNKTNLGKWETGTKVNLERCVKVNDRIDGHFVQGHVDTTTTCAQVEKKDGSWEYTFVLPNTYKHLVVDKGSIAINGTSLTLILDNHNNEIFKVAVIPYTYEYTNFHQLKAGDKVNLEFDILGKYMARFKEVGYKQ